MDIPSEPDSNAAGMATVEVKAIREVIYRDLFGGGSWGIDKSIKPDGNCFFECVSKALGQESGVGFSPQVIRDALAATVTPENFEDMVRDYVVNAPNSRLAAVYNTIESPELLKVAIRSSLHYATTSDIRMVERLIGTHIIVINGIYNPASDDYVLKTPVHGHFPDHAHFNRYILLIHGGEHFELVLGGKFRMVHSKAQVPPALLTLYENGMAEEPPAAE